MQCAKCGAKNADDAEFCSLCFETFKPKVASKPQTLIIPDITCEFGYWETKGPLMATRDALFFFANTLTDITEKKSLKRKVHNNMMEKGILGLAVGMALSKSFDEKRPLKPEEVQVKVVHWDKEPLLKYVEVKPAIGNPDDFFVLEKKEITMIKITPVICRYHIHTKSTEFIIDFIEESDKLSGFLRSSGFILEH